MEGKQTGPSEATSSNFGSGFSDFQGRGDGFSRLLNQNQHQTTVMGAAAISAVPSRRRSARARDPRLTGASLVASGQTAEGIAAQAGDGSAQIFPHQMHISGYSRGQIAGGIAAHAGVGRAQISPQQMHISGHSRGQTAEGIAAQVGVRSALIHSQQMHISGYSRGQTVEGFAAQAGFGSAWIHPPQMHISGYRRGQTVEGLAAQAGVRSARLPSRQIDLSGHIRGSSSRKRSAGDSTTASGSQRRRTTYLPSSGLPILPRSFPVYHTEVPTVEFVIEAPRLSGETCFICKWDTAITPEAGRVELPQVAVLPCGHCYHDRCLETRTPADQRANPPCLACASKLQ